ncbi:MAG: FtsX-like permease family protein [Oscillospiraceae bacterium]|nr:FtsX-like permease family protein [Oscillospiraceae bacterium]
MELLTLLKANIRHKKGSFISIIVLMIIVATSFTSIISTKDNVISSGLKEHERLNTPNVAVFIKSGNLTEELLQSVENSELTKDTAVYPAVASDKMICGSGEYTNAMFVAKLRDDYRLFNRNLDGYEDKMPALKKGEIYLTLGIRSKMPCEVGDTVILKTIFGDYDFKVAGFIVEPLLGSAMIGWKQIFVSDESFDEMHEACKTVTTDDISADYKMLSIYKADDCRLSDIKFCRQLNLETGLMDNALGSMSQESSVYYTNLFAQTILKVLMIFVSFLFVIVIIVMAHSITTGIEMEYVSIGVLKAQGFSDLKIKAVFALQYLTAQLFGTIIGMLAAIPLTKVIAGIFLTLNAIVPQNKISFLKVTAVIVSILIISVLIIAAATSKIKKISPITAINGGKNDVYFASRLNIPIRKKGLIASIALRQFTSAKRQYVGIIAIVSILVFFMMTMMITGNSISSRDAMESMGGFMTDIKITINHDISDEKTAEIEHSVSEITEITKKVYKSSCYLSVEGEQIYTIIYKNPEQIGSILRGRAPLYENEVMITDIVAEALDVNIGDTITISKNNEKYEYLIVGSCQNLNDTGMVITMGLKGAERLGDVCFTRSGYNLAGSGKASEVVKMLNEKYGDILQASELDYKSELGFIQTAVEGMKLVIYLFSAVFSLVAVNMACKKAFLKERTDIGIYKAVGFTSGKLRLQFALRYLIAAVCGSVLGAAVSMILSGYLLNALLRVTGITSFVIKYTPATFIYPVLMICTCFFVFSYIASRKVKTVEVTELISE